MQPTIISSYDPGRHNIDLDKTVSHLESAAQYKDLSLVILIPAYKNFPPRVVAAWLNLVNPPNNKLARIFATGMEVGEAYSRTIEAIVQHPHMGSWKYLLTMEHDNIPPPGGIMDLIRRMESEEGQKFAAIGGLYFTKGDGGVAQIWGDPDDPEFNFRPQNPDTNGGLKPCNGAGMGFTLFRMSMFRDGKISKPWFKTEPNKTQDLYFWEKANKEAGYRCAVDCGVRVGHYSEDGDVVW